MDEAKDPTARTGDFVTTRMAAEILGVSVGTVINMVDRGQLIAWRTGGGHRRVTRESVKDRLEYMKNKAAKQTVRLRVLAIEDDPFLRDVYSDEVTEWNLPVEMRTQANGVGGLIEIGSFAPDVLLLDLGLPEIDGFEVLNYLRASPVYRDIDVIVISGLTPEQITEKGGVPEGVLFWRKPLSMAQLRGYIEARLTSKQPRISRLANRK